MSVNPGGEIGEEVHQVDQFIRLEAGSATFSLNGVKHEATKNSSVVIPAGVCHNVINTGEKVLKLYSVYCPPEHKDKTQIATKKDEQGEEFDGITTE